MKKLIALLAIASIAWIPLSAQAEGQVCCKQGAACCGAAKGQCPMTGKAAKAEKKAAKKVEKKTAKNQPQQK